MAMTSLPTSEVYDPSTTTSRIVSADCTVGFAIAIAGLALRVAISVASEAFAENS